MGTPRGPGGGRIVAVAVVVVAALSILSACSKDPGSNDSGSNDSGSGQAADTTSGGSGDTDAPTTTAGGGGEGSTADATADLVLTGSDVSGSWTLDGGDDISPTTELIAAVWTETVDNVDAGYGDLVVVSMGGTIVDGTQATASAGVILGISISRYDAQGAALFDHIFTSSAGECEVTMQRTETGVSGTFACTGIADGDGHTADATGSFAT